MFLIEKDFSFEAAHFLPYHKGKCSRLHGHSFKATVTIASISLQENPASDCGMLMDFADLKKIMTPLIDDYLDHRCLNDFIDNPTAENLAFAIAQYVKKELAFFERQLSLIQVTVHETCTARATYSIVL
jgi:6-pyruvoyltetrahydropterin/6-carboxytetrahydropterin synthase